MSEKAELLRGKLLEFLQGKLKTEETDLELLILDYAATGVKLPNVIMRKLWVLENMPNEEFLEDFEKEVNILIGD